MFCKVNIMLFSILVVNMITESLGRWAGGSVVGGSVDKWLVVSSLVVGESVVGGFNKTLLVWYFLLHCPIHHMKTTSFSVQT